MKLRSTNNNKNNQRRRIDNDNRTHNNNNDSSYDDNNEEYNVPNDIIDEDEEMDDGEKIDDDNDGEFIPSKYRKSNNNNNHQSSSSSSLRSSSNNDQQQQQQQQQPRYNTRRSSRNQLDLNNHTRRRTVQLLDIDDTSTTTTSSTKKKRSRPRVNPQQVQDASGVLISDRTHATRQRAERLQQEYAAEADRRLEELRSMGDELMTQEEDHDHGRSSASSVMNHANNKNTITTTTTTTTTVVPDDDGITKNNSAIVVREARAPTIVAVVDQKDDLESNVTTTTITTTTITDVENHQTKTEEETILCVKTEQNSRIVDLTTSAAEQVLATTKSEEKKEEESIEKKEEEEEGESDEEDDHVDVRVPTMKRWVNQEEGKDVLLPHGLASILRPHQLDGVRFCWNTVVRPEKKSRGCILAHSMGLGKTLQMISFVYLYLIRKKGRRVLVLAPKSTLLNWQFEFNEKWVKYYDRNVSIPTYLIEDYERSRKQRWMKIKQWLDGGVLFLSYEMFRSLVDDSEQSDEKSAKNEKREEMNDDEDEDGWDEDSGAPLDTSGDSYSSFVISSPNKSPKTRKPKTAEWHKYRRKFQNALFQKTELIICDEGHKIKNPETKLSKVITKVQTRDRIVLTGTPLQNHLMEYFTMIDFVRPGYWTRDEFEVFFARPIQEGFKVDASESCVSIMKRRAYKLADEVKPFIDRRDQRILRDSLPKKTEFVILFKINEFQELLYKAFLKENEGKRSPMALLYRFAILSKIVNHPDLLIMYAERKGLADKLKEKTKNDNNLVDSDDDDDDNDDDNDDDQYEPEQKKPKIESQENTTESTIVKREVVSTTIDIDSDSDDEVSIIETVSNEKIEVVSEVTSTASSSSVTIEEQSSIEIDDDDEDEDDILSMDLINTVKNSVRRETPKPTTPPKQEIKPENRSPLPVDNTEDDILQTSRTNNKRKRDARSSKKPSRRNRRSGEGNSSSNNDDMLDDDLLDMYAEDERIVRKDIRKQKKTLSWDWLEPVLRPDYVRDLITRSPKMEFLVRLIEKCYFTDEKILVFSMFTETLTLIENVLGYRCQFQVSENEKRSLNRDLDYYRLDGSVSMNDRQRMIDDFNRPEGKQRVFLISILAGSLGINLTSATRVVLFDVPWVPATSQQAIFRAYRYGQTKPVFIYRFVSAGTIENRVFNRCVLKTWLFKRVVDNDAPKRILEETDLDLFDSNLDEFAETKLINSEIYKDDLMLASALGLGHVPDGTHRLAPVDITVDATQLDAAQTDASPSTAPVVTRVSNSNTYIEASEQAERRLQEEENRIGELDVKRKIVAVYHHESLYIDDLEEKISDQEKMLGDVEYQQRGVVREEQRNLQAAMQSQPRRTPGVSTTQSVSEATPSSSPAPSSMPQPSLVTPNIPPTPILAPSIPATTSTPSTATTSATAPGSDYAALVQHMHCNCVDCHQLRTFLQDGSASELRLRISKRRRQHVHVVIGQSPILRHMSEGQGRSRTLIVHKVARAPQATVPGLANRFLNHMIQQATMTGTPASQIQEWFRAMMEQLGARNPT